MIKLETSFTLPMDVAQAWEALSDPAFVASCIPGARITDTGGEGIHKGEIQFRFGPTVAVFVGQVQLLYDHETRRCTIKASGADRKGASRAIANFDLEAHQGANGTEASLIGGFNVIGPLEMFATSGGVHVAKALTVEFAQNMAKAIELRSPAREQPDEPSSPPATTGTVTTVAATPSTATTVRIGWRILLEWLKSFVARRSADSPREALDRESSGAAGSTASPQVRKSPR